MDDNPSDSLTWGVPFNHFANFYPTLGGFHPGEDWNLVGGSPNADLGKPVYAIGEGLVTKVSSLGSLGYLVELEHVGSFAIPGRTDTEHGETYSYPTENVSSFQSIYVHVREVPVSPGQCVSKGAVLGYIMNPGGGPHLHFETRHPGTRESRNGSMVGPPSNWVRPVNGYYIHVGPMVDVAVGGGVRHPRDFILANTLSQFFSDGETPLPFGGSTTESTVVTKGAVAHPLGKSQNVQLEVEVQPLGTSFSGVANCTTGPPVAPENTAIATCSSLAPGSYHWQGRPLGADGSLGSWVIAGANSEDETDFDVLPLEVIAEQPVSTDFDGEYITNASEKRVQNLSLPAFNVSQITFRTKCEPGDSATWWSQILGTTVDPTKPDGIAPDFANVYATSQEVTFDDAVSDCSDQTYDLTFPYAGEAISAGEYFITWERRSGGVNLDFYVYGSNTNQVDGRCLRYHDDQSFDEACSLDDLYYVVYGLG